MPENYTLANFRAWTDRSRGNLGVDTLDLVQLHCPPTAVFSSDEVFDALDTLVVEERIAAYGVSVETVDQALTAIARRGTATVQIIFNAFRRKPLELVLPAAAAAGVGIIARVPLATGLLSGRYTRDTTFAEDDHRTYNRHGEAFDVGRDVLRGGLRDRGRGRRRSSPGWLRPGPPRRRPRWPGSSSSPGSPRSSRAPATRSRPGRTRRRPRAAAGPAALDAIENLYDKYFRAAIHSRW